MTVRNLTVAPVKGAIRNPANPDHFMVVQSVGTNVLVHINGRLVAQTGSALCVIEIGNLAYEPRFYIPTDDIKIELSRTSKSTHCPLKGEAFYVALDAVEVGWGYDTFDFANVLQGYVSFNVSNMQITQIS
ncbi:hypothetical protein DL239_19890 [Sedimentitalea sp. CY04]|uniref:DUF427 domain-containing protein n=1 Tax=Parasedimentitalea denitrificans TaxID=2211118 RepID=A0ABX0WCP5_9RHOB|nr:DUF427 domain-containing protein [Sedimentitalea sp. CY04]NIZ63231.1 hypothetical protein [Sedimentitalea sp. CY04]